jgi:hypothetical protein
LEGTPSNAFLLFLAAKMRKSRFMLRAMTLYLLMTGGTFLVPAQTKPPSFTRFPVAVERTRASGVDFRSDAGARSFRTRLSSAFLGGVNFAGHYIVAGWGCGTGCISGAVIDARNGRVHWPIQLYAMATGIDGDNYVDKPVEYRKNSRLLILRGSPGVKDGETEKPSGEYYYEWRDNDLRLIKFVPNKKADN